MRTRDEQASVLMQVICDAGWKSSDAYDLAIREILEAERRAEQRVLAEIGRDSERLDWMEKQPKSVMSDGKRSRILFYSPELGPWDDIREAIDAAREVG